jgi:hypothetical protein
MDLVAFDFEQLIDDYALTEGTRTRTATAVTVGLERMLAWAENKAIERHGQHLLF